MANPTRQLTLSYRPKALLSTSRQSTLNASLPAYGFDAPPKPGDKAQPQAPPTRNLRPNQDPVEQTKPRQVNGSAATYSLVDVRDGQNVIDWFPGDHPPMPNVVAHGPVKLAASTRGCGSCHLPNGKGRPENAPPSGLPVTYFVRQIQDFRNGLRHTADPRKPNTSDRPRPR
jgi:cytochrome c553